MDAKSSVVLAEILDPNNEIVARVHSIFAENHVVIEARPAAVVGEGWQDALARLCQSTILLLPNGMLRISGAESAASTDLAEAVHDFSGGQFRVVKRSQGIEEGLAMKMRAWANEEHTVPFKQFVKQLKESSRLG